MSIIKPGEIRVDVLVISKVKQGLKGGEGGKGLEKNKNNKKLSSHFLDKKQEENKRNHPKTNAERRNGFGLSKNLLQLLGNVPFPVL